MYLRFEFRKPFPELARALCPDIAESALGWDSENVYEWMYLELPPLNFLLNFSRNHGWGAIEDDDPRSQQQLEQAVQPGPIYVFGWDREKQTYADPLPDWLPTFIAERLAVDVLVFDQEFNADIPNGEPIRVVRP